MQTIQMEKLAVGAPYPGLNPGEGPRMELAGDGSPSLTINMPGMDRAERKALRKGFSQYALHETSAAGITLLTWVFCFPNPIGYLDMPFHVGLYPDDRGQKLTEWSGNALFVMGLDGGIVTLMRQSGLQPEAVALFQRIAARQIEERPTREQYYRAVATVQQHEPRSLFKSGHQFRHRARSSKKE